MGAIQMSEMEYISLLSVKHSKRKNHSLYIEQASYFVTKSLTS